MKARDPGGCAQEYERKANGGLVHESLVILERHDFIREASV